MIVFFLLTALAQQPKTEITTSEDRIETTEKNNEQKNEQKNDAKKPPPLPKYEFGLGYIHGKLPDYPGANETTVRSFPIPYFVYRGEVLQAEEGGIKTRFLRGKYYEYDFSFAGSFPSNSGDNDARDGMTDLGWMFEVGPQLKLFLHRSEKHNWTLRFPVRAIFSIDDGKVNGRGYSFNPNLQVAFPKFPFKRNILMLGLTTEIATQKTHQYFYDVKPKFATVDRPIYESDDGTLGTAANITLITSWSKFSLFLNSTWSFYGEAKNKQSPLHLDNRTNTITGGLIWSFYKSKEQGFR
jgi:outer membrane protein